LREAGIDEARVVTQACPGLADTISEDREGIRSAAEISHWVREAAAKLPRPDGRVIAALACTHYGYRRDQFEDALRSEGVPARVVNPNESAVQDIFGTRATDGPHREAAVAFITRYAIPPETVEALTHFLQAISPPTVEAMRNFEHVPDLF
jgi:glutamate racemase